MNSLLNTAANIKNMDQLLLLIALCVVQVGIVGSLTWFGLLNSFPLPNLHVRTHSEMLFVAGFAAIESVALGTKPRTGKLKDLFVLPDYVGKSVYIFIMLYDARLCIAGLVSHIGVITVNRIQESRKAKIYDVQGYDNSGMDYEPYSAPL
jgi:hypothetical protein